MYNNEKRLATNEQFIMCLCSRETGKPIVKQNTFDEEHIAVEAAQHWNKINLFEDYKPGADPMIYKDGTYGTFADVFQLCRVR